MPPQRKKALLQTKLLSSDFLNLKDKKISVSKKATAMRTQTIVPGCAKLRVYFKKIGKMAQRNAEILAKPKPFCRSVRFNSLSSYFFVRIEFFFLMAGECKEVF